MLENQLNNSLRNKIDKYRQQINVPSIYLLGNNSSEEYKIESHVEKQYAITENTLIPLGRISEIIIAVLICEAVEQDKISLEDPIRKHLKYLNLKEGRFSLQFITIKSLLTHSSGIGNIANKRDLLDNNRGIWQDHISFPSQTKLYNRQIETVTSTNMNYLTTIHNYGILSALLEEINGKSIKVQISKFLSKIIGEIDPFDVDRINNAVGYKSQNNEFKQIQPKITQFYATRHITLTAGELTKVLSAIYGDNPLISKTTQNMMVAQYFQSHQEIDGVSMSFISRKNPEILIGQSEFNGFFIKIIIIPAKREFTALIINSHKPAVQRYTHLIGNLLLRHLHNLPINPIPVKEKLSSEIIANITGLYRVIKFNPLASNVLSQLGGELFIGDKNDQIYLIDNLAGFFQSEVHQPRRLDVLSTNGSIIQLGFWDGLGYQKVVITSTTTPAFIYVDINGPTLQFRAGESRKTFRYNVKLHWRYFKTKIFPPFYLSIPKYSKQTVVLMATYILIFCRKIINFLQQIDYSKFGEQLSRSIIRIIDTSVIIITKITDLIHKTYTYLKGIFAPYLKIFYYRVTRTYHLFVFLLAEKLIKYLPKFKTKIKLPWNKINLRYEIFRKNITKRRKMINKLEDRYPSKLTFNYSGLKYCYLLIKYKFTKISRNFDNRFLHFKYSLRKVSKRITTKLTLIL